MSGSKAFLTVLLFFCVFPALVASAQPGGGPHALHDDSWALQFSIGPDFTVRSFEGSTLSVKRHTSAEHAWQVGLSLDGNFLHSTMQEADSVGEESNSTDLRVQLTARYLTYPLLEAGRQRESIQLFAGAGPLVSYDRDVHSTQDFDHKRRRTSFDVGASGVLGAEWFLKERLSLSAAYESSLAYSRTHIRDTREDDPEGSVKRTSSGVRLNAGGVLFGLSVYF